MNSVLMLLYFSSCFSKKLNRYTGACFTFHSLSGIHLVQGISNDFFQFFHQVIIINDMLVEILQFADINLGELLGELLLQKLFVVLESHQVVVVHDQVGQLWIKLLLVKLPMDLLQIGEQGIILLSSKLIKPPANQVWDRDLIP